MSSAGIYLRWPRFIAFQLTSALCITVVGLASWGLRIGVDKKAFVKKTIPGAHLDIANALNSGGAVTAAAGVASLLCLAFNLLAHFRPHQRETLNSVRLREGAFAFACVFWVATLIPATYILATGSGVISKPGVSPAVIAQIVALSGQHLEYTAITAIKAYVIVGWMAFLSTVLNLVLVSLAFRHIHKYGPGGEIGALVPGHSDPHHTENKLTGTDTVNSEKAAAPRHLDETSHA